MSKNVDLAKLLGVDHLIDKRSIVDETKKDVDGKTGQEMTLDIVALIEHINLCIMKQDINGAIACIEAIQLRVNGMREMAEAIKKQFGL